MGDVHPHPPVLLLLAAFSRYPAALVWTRQKLEDTWGPLALESPPFEFLETDYYQPTMGGPLIKQFFACQQLLPAADLPQVKLLTNQWERDYAASADHPEPRPLNLDPGYIDLGKLVLASTKDHMHRIYLDQGIYAEITLSYRQRGWHAWDWTFPDYRRADYHEFFSRCRQYYYQRQRGEEPTDG